MSNTKKTKKKTTKKSRGMKIFLRVFFTLALIGIMTGSILAGSFFYYVTGYLNPQMEIDLDSYKLAYTSVVYYYDDEGVEHELERLYATENREWVPLSQIPKHMQDAAVAIEDERFWEHDGVDWKRTIAATLNLFTGGNTNFGGSTIPQQVVKNVTGDDSYSITRKLEEILRALNLADEYSKEEILEFYLNTAYFSQNTNGVQTAAKVYFGKDVSELSLAESASIIGITQYPTRYDPFQNPDYNKDRQETILWQMFNLGMISEDEYEAAKAEELIFQKEVAQEQNSQVQSWFVDQVIFDVLDDLQSEKGYTESYAENLLYNGGLKIYATVDTDIQNIMETAFEDPETFPTLSGEEQPEASMVILDPYTGAIKGIVGGRGEKTGALLLNMASTSRRQPGSIIKPLSVYAPAIEYNIITQGSVYDDTPVDVEDRYPRNYDSSYAPYEGLMSVKRAVYRSVNTVALRVLDELGVERGFEFITERLGVDLIKSENINGQIKTDMARAPLAMGGVTYGVTNVEMAAAYAAFANKGVYNEPYSYTKVLANDGTVLLEHVPDPQIAMSEQTAFLINDLLQGVAKYGTGTPANLGSMPIAVKTGTTSDDKDRWFAGYSPYYVGTVWFGYKQPETIRYSGVNPALQGWKAVMSEVHEELEPQNFFTTSGLVQSAFCMDSGMLPTEYCNIDARGNRVDTAWYKRGTEPTEPCTVHVPATLCGDTNMIATPYCPGSTTKIVGLLNLRREFPYSIAITDAQYTYLPLPDGYVIPADSSVPVYQNLLTEGMNPGYSPGVDDPMNHLCILHYGYSAPQPGDANYYPGITPVTPDGLFNTEVPPTDTGIDGTIIDPNVTPPDITNPDGMGDLRDPVEPEDPSDLTEPTDPTDYLPGDDWDWTQPPPGV